MDPNGPILLCFFLLRGGQIVGGGLTSDSGVPAALWAVRVAAPRFYRRFRTKRQRCQGHLGGCWWDFLFWGGGGVVQFVPHGATEELLERDHCSADCARSLPVFSSFTVHCLPVSRSVGGAGGRRVAPDPPVQMAVLTAQKTAPRCHPLPPGAFAIFFNQPLHSGWVAAVCTVLAGAV